LAEPAAAAASRGPKKRAKNDCADARHLRELFVAGRLPESWVAPAHILDLRAKVRLRHTLSEQRGEWRQRIQSVLANRHAHWASGRTPDDSPAADSCRPYRSPANSSTRRSPRTARHQRWSVGRCQPRHAWRTARPLQDVSALDLVIERADLRPASGLGRPVEVRSWLGSCVTHTQGPVSPAYGWDRQ
jgi:hypothetical protein